MFFAMESYLTDKSDLADFPTLVLDMGGYERVLEPEHYIFKYDDIYIWGVGESTFPIVGDVALNELVVVFDQANNKVGFADATCASDDDDSASASSSTHTHSKSKHHSKSDAADVNLAAAATSLLTWDCRRGAAALWCTQIRRAARATWTSWRKKRCTVDRG